MKLKGYWEKARMEKYFAFLYKKNFFLKVFLALNKTTK